MDEQHQMLYDAVKHNQMLLEQQIVANSACKSDRDKLRYMIYGLAAVMLVVIGKPDWIIALF
jgi:hypothetical protein